MQQKQTKIRIALAYTMAEDPLAAKIFLYTFICCRSFGLLLALVNEFLKKNERQTKKIPILKSDFCFRQNQTVKDNPSLALLRC